MHIEPKLITCKNCGNQFEGKFCNQCGEKVYHLRDRSVTHLLGEGFHFLTHFEGSFFNTLKTIVTRPGKLSLDYCSGLRKRYFKPISFFLMLVILYLLFPVFEGLNMKLYYHLRHDFYGSYAMEKVKSLMTARSLSEEDMADLFHRKSEKTSKFLLFILLPFMGLVSWGLGFRKRRLFFDHFIFSIEVSSIFILWGFLVLPLIVILCRMAGLGLLINSETESGMAMGSVFLTYLILASRKFFGFRWWYCAVYAIIYMVIMILFLEYVYKLLLFWISFHLI